MLVGADSKTLLKQLAHSGYQYTVSSIDGPGMVSLRTYPKWDKDIQSGDKELLGQGNIKFPIPWSLPSTT